MKKRLISMLLLLGAISFQVCAQRLIVNASLKNVLGENVQAAITPENVPSDLSDWVFTNCSTKIVSGSNYLKVSKGGSITTAPLVGVEGNVTFSAIIYPFEKTITLDIEVIGNGELTVSSVSNLSKLSWNRFLPLLLRNADENTRLRFSSKDDDFLIVNLNVLDIEDGVFYESFNLYNSTGGNDGDFSSTGTSDIKLSYLDNPPSGDVDDYLPQVKWASQCIYMNANGKYYFISVPESVTGDYMLSFRVAGQSSNRALSVKYKGKDGKTKTKSVTSEVNVGSWKTITVSLPNMDPTYKTFLEGQYVYLDDILLSEIKYMNLDEKVDNSDVITERGGKTVYACLMRTLAANIWNTCCLPFSLTAEQLKDASGIDDLTIEMMHLTKISDGVFTFSKTSSVAAGEPFFVRVDHAIANPVFSNVSVEAEEPSCISDDGYGFQGIYSRTPLNTDGTHVFLGTDGKMHKPTSNNNMNGMRAYFIVPQGGEARVAFIDDDDVTSVRSIRDNRPSAPSCLYNMQGQRVNSLAKGLFIQNGKKIFVK